MRSNSRLLSLNWATWKGPSLNVTLTGDLVIISPEPLDEIWRKKNNHEKNRLLVDTYIDKNFIQDITFLNYHPNAPVICDHSNPHSLKSSREGEELFTVPADRETTQALYFIGLIRKSNINSIPLGRGGGGCVKLFDCITTLHISNYR